MCQCTSLNLSRTHHNCIFRSLGRSLYPFSLFVLNSIFIISLFRKNRMKRNESGVMGVTDEPFIIYPSFSLYSHTHTLEQNWFIHKVQTAFNDVLPFDSMSCHVISFHSSDSSFLRQCVRTQCCFFVLFVAKNKNLIRKMNGR